MRHSVCSHDLFPARVEQGKHYECNGLDLVAPTPEQYEKYSDGSHRGKKQLGENEKLENEWKRGKVRTKAGERAKKDDLAGTSKDLDLAELMRRREEQVAMQNAGKMEARKREDILEQERATADKKIQAEEERKDREENKRRRVKEEWQKSVKLAEEQRRKEDKAQFDKSQNLGYSGGLFSGSSSKEGGQEGNDQYRSRQ